MMTESLRLCATVLMQYVLHAGPRQDRANLCLKAKCYGAVRYPNVIERENSLIALYVEVKLVMNSYDGIKHS